jgi:predicted nucleic acid-binding protein
LNANEQFQAIAASTANLTGGGICDALIAHCALKAKAETIYTWDTKDFKRLSPSIADRAKTP